MAKISIILDKRKADKLGRYPVKLRIVQGNTNTTISTGVFVPESVFIGEPEHAVSRTFANAKQTNASIKEIYYSYINAIIELEKKGNAKAYTAADIRDYVDKGKEYQSVRTFSSTIEEYKESRRTYNTKRTYSYTIDLLNEFTKNKTIFFEDVSYKFLVDFNSWMEKKGFRGGSRDIILHNIRAVYNYAINNDYVSLSLYPFRKFPIRKHEREKIFLKEDKFAKLQKLNFTGSKRHTVGQARDVFLLSFYLCGANPIDLFNMELPKDNVVSFVRQKVNYHDPKQVHISIQPEAQAIIDKYKGKTHLLNFIENYSSYNSFYTNICKYIKEVGEEIEEKEITMYWARYSWATYASKLDISDYIISKALGHSDATMAQRKYISFDWSKVDKANRRVIDYAVYGKE